MDIRNALLGLATAAILTGAFAQEPVDPYAGVNKQAQERLRALGFYSGPVNGDIGPNTQAAIAQFQLSVPLPASGSLDEATLAALGVERQLAGSCDALIGPERDRCVQQGGSVEASANAEASAGASSPPEVKGN
jgi:hypothetical protein